MLPVRQLKPGMWAPGKQVAIRDAALDCQLDFERAYLFFEESGGFLERPFQSGGPHLEFLEVKDEQGLVRFVQRWGPIVLNPDHRLTGKSILPLSRYWLTHRYLWRIVRLLSSFHSESEEAEGLGGFLELRSDWLGFLETSARVQGWKVREDSQYLKWLSEFVNAVQTLAKVTDEIGVRTGEEGQIAKILEGEPLHYIRRLMDLTVSNCFEVTTFPQPMRRSGQRPTIIPRPKANELEKALEYLIFLGAWSEHPLYQCRECGKLFLSNTRRRRRYCGQECANRVSSRNFKRAVRAKQRQDRGGVKK